LIALALAVVGSALVWALVAPQPCQRESAYFCISVEVDATNGSQRLLRMDTLRHAYVDLDDPTHLEFAYTRLLGDVADAIAPDRAPISALHIGGGGFTMPRYVAATRLGSVNRVLELDPLVLQVAREELGLTTSDELTVVIGDGRLSVGDEPTGRYDLVIGDAFAGPAVPWHLTTAEFVAQVRRVLKPGGIYAANIIDYPPLELARAQLATFAEVFEHVGIYGPASRVDGTTGGNVILLASDRPLPVAAIKEANLARGGGDHVATSQPQVGTFIEGAPVLRDDFAPTDQLLTRFD
jgi:SAM-dependent methyltransferase